MLDNLHCERVTLVGQSLGGYISQEVLYSHPHRVTALVIIGSTPVTMTFSTTDMLALRHSPTMFRLWPDGHLRRLIARSTAVTPAAQEYAYEATRQVSKKDFLTIWEGVAQALHPEPDYRITHPLLLTHGDRDNTGRIRKAAPLWAARDPNCRYVVIPNAGHNANQDNHEFFNQVLLEFLHEHVPAATPGGDEPRALFE